MSELGPSINHSAIPDSFKFTALVAHSNNHSRWLRGRQISFIKRQSVHIIAQRIKGSKWVMSS